MEKVNLVSHRNSLDVELPMHSEVLPKLKGLRQVKRLALLVILISTSTLYAQKKVLKEIPPQSGEVYAFTKCDNNHYVVASGYTLREPVIDNFKVTITKDSIIFSKPVITATKRTRFKIEKREESQRYGLNLILIVVGDERTRTAISIIIEDKFSSPSDTTIVKRISTQFDQ